MSSTGNLTIAHTAVEALDVLTSLRPGQRPTPEQRTALAQWPGWGPLAPAFDPGEQTPAWEAISDHLHATLSPEELRDARECVDNSFYTSPLVVSTVYDLLTAAGFTGGKVLEPGCGSGNFMRHAPAGLPLEFVGVERDRISARFAAALNPTATIIRSRLEKATLPKDFDVVVGNVPFSSQRIDDPVSHINASLHNYFLLRGLASLRDGGYLAAVTSRFSVDGVKANGVTSDTLFGGLTGAEFIGALRLPTNAFKGEGTSVVADIVVFRKNSATPRFAPAAGWRPTPTRRASNYYPYHSEPAPQHVVRTDDREVAISEYWGAFPDHVAGTLTATKHYRNPLDVVSSDPAADISAAAAALSQVISSAPMFTAPSAAAAMTALDVALTDADGRKEGSFHLIDGDTLRVKGGLLTPTRASRELAALIGLRDQVLDLLKREADLDASDESMAGLRADLLGAYLDYTRQWGPLNRGTLVVGADDADTGMPTLTWKRPTLGGFRSDPDYVAVMALERYDQDTNAAEPAAILLRRVNHAPVQVTHAGSPADALRISLGETGRVDLARIAGLLDLPTAAHAADALGDLVYRDPDQRGQWIPARNYLCGNVRAKKARAEQAALADDTYARNVAALTAATPPDLTPNLIRMRLGNPCLTSVDVTDFIREVFEAGARVERSVATGGWKVDGYGGGMLVNTIYGTPRMSAFALVEIGLAGKSPVVYDEISAGRTKQKIRNADQTIAAQEKLNQIQDRLGVWVWEDPDRAERLTREYNRRFNSYVRRTADGSHLTHPGMSDAFTPYTWQNDAVDSVTSLPGYLCGHDVGAGKTGTMIMSAMALRRFGLANKPAIIVPNHLLEQIAREAKQIFPLGKFLIAGKEDLAGDARRLFAARCATDDWDAVVMTHQGFGSIPVDPDTEQEWLEQQKDRYESHLRRGAGYGFAAKDIARRVRTLENRLEALRHDARRDTSMILWPHLGIDHIQVDEGHHFKRLDTGSRAEGFSMGTSKRALDLLLKCDVNRRQRPGRPSHALYTATPWTNSLGETWVWLKFTVPDALVEAGVDNFDTFASVFIRRQTVVEVSPDGSGFRTATRATHLINVPDLLNMLNQAASILSAEQMGLEQPDVEMFNIAVDQSPGQQAFVHGLADRYEKARTATNARGKDHRFSVFNDGRRVALDPRLVDVDEDSTKIAEFARIAARIYREGLTRTYPGSAVPGVFQAVFCDQGTPNAETGTQTYGRMKAALIAEGVPAGTIRFVHEAKDDKARAALFAGCRDGSIAFLIGSTATMGEGTNIQARLVAIHHIDIAWRPSDMKQRNGRGLRPGNLNPVLGVYRYVTIGTYDAFMYQTAERKAIAFTAMYDNDPNIREIDDIGEVAPSFTIMKALATGSPLLLRQAEVAADVRRLRTLKAVDAQSCTAARKSIKKMLTDIADGDRWVQTMNRHVPVDRPQADPVDVVAAFRRSQENAYSYSGTPFVWAGFSCSLKARDGFFQVEVLTSTYGSAGVVFVGDLMSRSVSRAGRSLGEDMAQWQARVERRLREWALERARLEAQVRRAQAVIDGYTFPQEDALTAAEATLAAIDAEMLDEASKAERAAADVKEPVAA